MAAEIICWSGLDAGSITGAEWRVVIAARRILGRPLEASELQALLDAERGVHR